MTTRMDEGLRLCFVPGAWQLVVAVALLRYLDAAGGGPRPTALVLHPPGAAPADIERLAATARRLYAWDRVIEASDLLPPRAPAGLWPFPLGDVRSRLHERLGCRRAGEVWVCKITQYAERLALECFPEATVLQYEEGLGTYIPLAPMTPGRLVAAALAARAPLVTPARWRRYAISQRMHHWRVPSRYVARVSRIYGVVGDILPLAAPYPPSRYGAIPAADVTGVLREIAAGEPAETMAFRFQPDDVLLLGQCFASAGLLALDQETGLYADAVALLRSRGYRVWWKAHPRFRPTDVESLARAVPDLTAVPIQTRLPIECYLGVWQAKRMAGFTSTALFTARSLFAVETWTFARRLQPLLSGEHRVETSLVAARLPDVEGLPLSTGGQRRS